MIRNYTAKKLVEYLKPGMTVCLYLTHHGLGDQIMFRPLYLKLKELFPSVSFNFKAGANQEFFDDLHTNKFDEEFDIGFYEHDMHQVGLDCYNMSKPEVCCNVELGIPFSKELEFTWKPPAMPSKIKLKPNTIGIAPTVNSSSMRDMDEPIYHQVWDLVKDAGFTPMEVLFEPPNYRKIYKQPFVDYSCRNMDANIPNVYKVISQVTGFIGVNTGTFCCAVSLGKPVLHLWKIKPFYPYYKRFNRVMESRFIPYRLIVDDVIEFLDSLRKE